MNGYLIDTNVISVTAPANPARDQAALHWLERHTDLLFLSTVTIAEIESGIAHATRKEQQRKAALLTAWLDAMLHFYGRRVLPFDTKTACEAGRLSDFARSKGTSPGFADIAIAATAAMHGLMILTRNLRHFQPLGVPTLDPCQGPLP